MEQLKRKILLSIVALVLLICLAMILLYYGVIHINNPSKKKYPIKGVDVSHYQGEIDWDKLSKEDIKFAYIKATEGSQHKDEQFDENWSKAQNTDLRIGAYHFFSFDSSGTDQAQNFCNTVTVASKMLPPVVDVEPYGRYINLSDTDKEKMIEELQIYLQSVESFYKVKPVIYTTNEWWDVLKNKFSDYDLWIRDVYGKPDSSLNWTFWQYSNRHVLSGYSGTERYIDMNVFCGDEKEFYAYISEK
ncbi:GH25 family lysozyme [Butyrivibrio sp. NC3005]|uniref:GH25 family lysozyme n=1 Tax=Butyrivibrio sp. NC3005 TaxID=1280685 RepID=UPI000417FC54|nr:GH25 family lysozyme [Butyrivibrio sp. NC3005]